MAFSPGNMAVGEPVVRTQFIMGYTDNRAPEIRDNLFWYAELVPAKAADVINVDGFRASFGKLD